MRSIPIAAIAQRSLRRIVVLRGTPRTRRVAVTGLDHSTRSCIDWPRDEPPAEPRTTPRSSTSFPPRRGTRRQPTSTCARRASSSSLMNAEDASVPDAVAGARGAIAAAIDAIADRLAGGRPPRLRRARARRAGSPLVDAAECESTFAAPPGLVVALIAGGAASAATAQEHAEDDEDEGEREVAAARSRPARRGRRSQRERPDALRRSERSRRRAGRGAHGGGRLRRRTPSSAGSPSTRSRSSSAPR